ncbi:hypothetical protein [Staphylococcus pseudintermedius]|uniref:hypothetical protein n=1 Tax=Staphylococcus pseudintermedius TaxID=283734 RepID=UPI001F0F0D3F|nr:hypothetical protein [Staphylococcus pseudintermedius]
MIQIDGVGSYKLKHYCPEFLEAIQNIKCIVRKTSDGAGIPGSFFANKRFLIEW